MSSTRQKMIIIFISALIISLLFSIPAAKAGVLTVASRSRIPLNYSHEHNLSLDQDYQYDPNATEIAMLLEEAGIETSRIQFIRFNDSLEKKQDATITTLTFTGSNHVEFSAETPADSIHRLNTQILLLEKDIEWIKKLEFGIFSVLIALVITQALTYQNLRKKRRR